MSARRPEAQRFVPTTGELVGVAWIVTAPSRTGNGSMPDAGSTKAASESPKPPSDVDVRRLGVRMSAHVVPTPLCDTLSELNSSSNVSL